MSARPVALVLRLDAARCRATAEELRSCGFEAVEAPSIEAGLVLAAQRPFDVALCDAEGRCDRMRPLWQSLLASTVRRETVVVLVGQANSHQEMLAATPGSRLAICSSVDDEGIVQHARRLFARDGFVATLHGREAVESPHFAETRSFAESSAS